MARRLTLVAGRGLVAPGLAAARQAGWQVTVLAIDPALTGVDAAISADLEQAPHFLSLLEASQPDAICFVGAVRVSDRARAALADMLLSRTETLDDDALLDLAPRIAARVNAKLTAIHELLPDLLAPVGLLSGTDALMPEEQLQLAAGALKAARAIGAIGLGQAIVMAGTRPVAAEDATGTDALLKRVSAMRDKGLVGQAGQPLIFAKAPRPGQTQMLDLPTIGPRTVQLAADAGIGLIVVAAGQTLLVDRPAMIDIAQKTGLTLLALSDA